VLGGAAYRAFSDQFDEAGAIQFGHVVIDVAERGPQLIAEVTGGEGPPAVKGQDLQD
jgi:hypothetical protein